MMARTPLMAGNWKSNLNHQEAVVLVQKLAWTLQDKKHDGTRSEVVVIPPFTDIRSVQTLVDGDRLSLRYGAQDVSEHDGGAYTGEITAAMLAKLGCSYVVVGHSERREYHHETDAVVNAKTKRALAAEPPANSYGQRPDRDIVAVLERIGEARWRLVIPWPQAESNLDLIELVPA